jgi:hypothetical protein
VAGEIEGIAVIGKAFDEKSRFGVNGLISNGRYAARLQTSRESMNKGSQA